MENTFVESFIVEKPNIKVACILDTFSYECFKYEFNLIQLTPENWREILYRENLNFILVESAWKGLDEKWSRKIGYLWQSGDTTLEEIILFCKQIKIPTVFWNKEDPVYFKFFFPAARLFDYIFTTDENCIPNYKKLLGHERIYPLPFAAQIKIHNPIDKDNKKVRAVTFAGTWYSKEYPSRRKQLSFLLNSAIKYDLHIYDRNYNITHTDKYKFPESYQPYIKGYLTYEKMIEVYKKYQVFLNVNSVEDSPTMLSRRVLELLACGTNVISSFAVSIEQMFKDIVLISNCEKDTEFYLKLLLNDKQYADKLSLRGYREVLKNHTYTNRINTILDKLKIIYKKREDKGVSIIIPTNRKESIDKILGNYERQSYLNKELIIILNGNDMKLLEWQEKSKDFSNVRIFQLDENISLGECLNFAIKQAKFDYISRVDDDNYYGEEYIGDLMGAFKYTTADIVGKHTYYSYLKKSKKLILRFENLENCYVTFLNGASLVIKKKVFEKINFPNIRAGCDKYFIKECVKNGFKMYSVDRFNFVYTRYDDDDDDDDDDEFLRKCRFIEVTNEYIPYITS